MGEPASSFVGRNRVSKGLVCVMREIALEGKEKKSQLGKEVRLGEKLKGKLEAYAAELLELTKCRDGLDRNYLN